MRCFFLDVELDDVVGGAVVGLIGAVLLVVGIGGSGANFGSVGGVVAGGVVAVFDFLAGFFVAVGGGDPDCGRFCCFVGAAAGVSKSVSVSSSVMSRSCRL